MRINHAKSLDRRTLGRKAASLEGTLQRRMIRGIDATFDSGGTPLAGESPTRSRLLFVLANARLLARPLFPLTSVPDLDLVKQRSLFALLNDLDGPQLDLVLGMVLLLL